MKTHIYLWSHGARVEYRRRPYHPTILFLEHRELRTDGTPYDERWYPVSDAHLLGLQRQGSVALDLLAGLEAEG